MSSPLIRSLPATLYWYARSPKILLLLLLIMLGGASGMAASLYQHHNERTITATIQNAASVLDDLSDETDTRSRVLYRQLEAAIAKKNLTAIQDTEQQARTHLDTLHTDITTVEGHITCEQESTISVMATGSGDITLTINNQPVASGDHITGSSFHIEAASHSTAANVVWAWTLISGGPCV